MSVNTIDEAKRFSRSLLFAIFLGSGLIFLLPTMVGSLAIGALSGSPYVFAVVAASFVVSVFLGFLFYLLSKKLVEFFQITALIIPLLLLVLFLPAVDVSNFENISTKYPTFFAFKTFLFNFGLLIAFMTATIIKLIFWLQGDYNKTKNDYFSYMMTIVSCGVMSAFLAYFVMFEPLLPTTTCFAVWSFCYIMFVYVMVAGIILKYHRNGTTLKSLISEFKKSKCQHLDFDFNLKKDALVNTRLFGLVLIATAFVVATISKISAETTTSSSIWFAVIVFAALGAKMGFCRFAGFFQKIMLNCHLLAIITFFITTSIVTINNNLVFILVGLLPFIVWVIASYEIKKIIKDAKDIEQKFLVMFLGFLVSGVFLGLISFNVLSEYYEYVFIMLATILVRPNHHLSEEQKRNLVYFILISFLLTIVWLAFYKDVSQDFLKLILAFFLGSFYRYNDKVLKLFLAVFVVYILGQTVVDNEKVVRENRNFYGSYRITQGANNFYYLYRGSEPKASQIKMKALETKPTGFTAESTPVGQIFETFKDVNQKWNIAVIGVGSGSLLCYTTPEQKWTFFEPNYDLVDNVNYNKIFTHFTKCNKDNARIIVGDPKRNIAKSNQKYDLIIFDNYVTPGLPPYMFTTDAIRKYFDNLASNGLIVFNFTNRGLNYNHLFANQSRNSIALGVSQLWFSPTKVEEIFNAVSEWGVLSRNVNTVEKLIGNGKWFMMQENEKVGVWDDNHHSLFPIFRDYKNQYTSLFFERPLNFIRKTGNAITNAVLGFFVVLFLIFK